MSDIDKYIDKETWELKENSNISYSAQALNLFVAGKEVKKYWLNLYGGEIEKAHNDGYFHIHDLTGLMNYCGGYNMEDVLYRGFGIDVQSKSNPPKHLSSALGQLVNFLFSVAQEIAGAVAVSSFDTLLAPFVKEDKMSYEEVKQQIQEFIFNMNVSTRVGGQRVFSNLTIDLVVPNKYKTKKVFLGGVKKDYTHGDCQEEMNMINKALAEVMIAGDAHGKVFSFPIVTVNLTKDFDWTNFDELWELTGKYGAYTFANYINSDMDPESSRSLCCRLRLDQSVIPVRRGGLFGIESGTGCYDDKTEILTTDGWINFSALTREHTVFTMTKDKKIECHNPKKIFEYDWDGDLIKFKNDRFDMLITPNHRMLIEKDYSGSPVFVEARDYDPNHHTIPKQAEWDGYDAEFFELPSIENEWIGGNHNSTIKYKREPMKIGMGLWLKFFGLFISEGSFDNENIAPSHGYRVFISQIKRTKEVEDVLSAMPFNYVKEGDSYIICNKQLWSYLKQFGHCYYKYIPKEILSLPKNKLQILYDYLMIGDGSIKKSKNGKVAQETYYTSSRKLIDNVQEIIIKMGSIGIIRTRNRGTMTIEGRTHNTQNEYSISRHTSRNFFIRKDSITNEYYKGKVYCCEVENNSIMVRRNGCATWCGNSIGVCTISLPMIAVEAGGCKEKFLTLLNYYTNLAKSSLEIKRRVLEDLTEKGLYPYNKQILQPIKDEAGGYWANHFSTIGLIGANEACINMFSKGIDDPESKAWVIEVMNYLIGKTKQFNEETGHLYNAEASPGESSSYSLAQKALKKYPECAVQGEKDNAYFTNSTHLPVNYTSDIFTILEHQEDLQKLYTGGTTINFWLGQSITGDQAKMLVKKIAENYSLPYFSLSPTFSTCQAHGFIEGEHTECPTCGGPTETYTRIVGYFSPVSLWNKGKLAEFSQRLTYDGSTKID